LGLLPLKIGHMSAPLQGEIGGGEGGLPQARKTEVWAQGKGVLSRGVSVGYNVEKRAETFSRRPFREKERKLHQRLAGY